MTESEYLASADPAAMLASLLANRVQPTRERPDYVVSASDRRLRLFAVACCRQAWDGEVCPTCKGKKTVIEYPAGWRPDDALYTPIRDCRACHGSGRVVRLIDPRSRRAVEVAEKYADGKATIDQLFDAESSVIQVATERSGEWRLPLLAAGQLSDWSQVPPAAAHAGVPPAAQAGLLRCVFGNPWRPATLPTEYRKVITGPVTAYVEQCPWLAWNDGTVPKLAAAIYADRRWGDLPILADALEEAGCEATVRRRDAKGGPLPDFLASNPILAHLRGPGPHARGCWVVDLLLGKS